MVERFNGRVEDVLQSHHFRSGEELETTLHRYVWFYSQQLPQSALGTKTPLQAKKDCYKLKPDLLKKLPYYRPGCDSYLSMMLLCFGIALLANSLPRLLTSILAGSGLCLRVIRHEETYLQRQFGEQYKSYQRAICRWV